MNDLRGIIAGMILLLPNIVVGAEPDVAMPIHALCAPNKVVQDSINDIDELPFAYGVGLLNSAKDGTRYEGIIRIYVSAKGGFTITSEVTDGLECVLTTGLDFQPATLTELMH